MAEEIMKHTAAEESSEIAEDSSEMKEEADRFVRGEKL